MKPTEKIWCNGKFIAWDDARVHVLSHVIHYGSSVFEGIRCYETTAGPAIFRLREHVRRLADSAKIYRMDGLAFSQEVLADAMLELVRVNNMKSCYIRPIVFRGYGDVGVNGMKNPIEVYMASAGSVLGAIRVQLETQTSTPEARASSPRYLPHSQQAI